MANDVSVCVSGHQRLWLEQVPNHAGVPASRCHSDCHHLDCRKKGNTKKSTVSNMYFIGYAVGCIVGPQLWRTDEGPRFARGVSCNIACVCLLVCSFIFYRFSSLYENKRKEKMIQEQEPEDFGNEDVTDKQDIRFMYRS